MRLYLRSFSSLVVEQTGAAATAATAAAIVCRIHSTEIKTKPLSLPLKPMEIFYVLERG